MSQFSLIFFLQGWIENIQEPINYNVFLCGYSTEPDYCKQIKKETSTKMYTPRIFSTAGLRLEIMDETLLSLQLKWAHKYMKSRYWLGLCHGWFHMYWHNRAVRNAKQTRIIKRKIHTPVGFDPGTFRFQTRRVIDSWGELVVKRHNSQ